MMGIPVVVGVSFYRSPASSFATASANVLLAAWRDGEFAYSQTVLVATREDEETECILRTAVDRAVAVDLRRPIPAHPPSRGDLVLMGGDLRVIRRFGFEMVQTRAALRAQGPVPMMAHCGRAAGAAT